MTSGKRKGLLERLAAGPVIGDGSMCMTLEKRGYCTAGPWTPEATVLYPDAVRQLLREYLRAGADVLQTPCFYSSDGKLERSGIKFTSAQINEAACKLARSVADEGDAIVCGGLSPVVSYIQRKGEAAVRTEFENQLQVFIDYDVDFILAEFFGHVEEIEICIDVMKRAKKPMGATMRIGPAGDSHGVSVEECAVRMAKAGADMIGINCLYDINTCLKVLRRMKTALNEADLHPYLICQPLGWLCPEVEGNLNGYLSLAEAPLGLDPRTITRMDAHRFAREAYDIGVRYIGGCCGVEPHHIRAFSQELSKERNKNPAVDDLCPKLGAALGQSLLNNIRQKVPDEFWMNLVPATGRPFSPASSAPEETAEFKTS